MTTSRFFSYSLGFAASTVLALASGAARAACTTNTDCPQGFTCQVIGQTTCPAIACAPGETCPTCTPTTAMDCMPAPCTTDADCGPDMVCYTQTSTVCSAPTCAPGTTCSNLTTCTDTTTSTCVPKYTLPCTTDSDCGTGFSCVPEQSCVCSGGSVGTGSTGGGTVSTGYVDGGVTTSPTQPYPYDGGGILDPYYPPPYPYDAGSGSCTCTPGTTSYCQAQTITCTTNANCPTGWTCQEVGGYTMCSGVASTMDGGGTTTPTCTTVSGTLQCVPPYSQYVYPTKTGTYTAANGETLGAPTAGATSSPDGGQHTVGDAVGTGRAQDSGSCQMGSEHRDASSAAVLGLLGLVGLVRRRRAHR